MGAGEFLHDGDQAFEVVLVESAQTPGHRGDRGLGPRQRRLGQDAVHRGVPRRTDRARIGGDAGGEQFGVDLVDLTVSVLSERYWKGSRAYYSPPGAWLTQLGVDTCFMNPGTSEMQFVAALDRVEGVRPVLALFEGVVTGAADGYARMAEKPAATLLHLDERHDSRLVWADWFARVGYDFAPPTAITVANDYSVLLQATLEGQGVGLGWHHIVEGLVASGSLVRPVDEAVEGDPFFLHASPRRDLSPAARAFRDWLVLEYELAGKHTA